MEKDSESRFKLTPAKRALLDAILRERGLAPLEQGAIPRRDGTDPAPLSLAQQRIWFLSHFEQNDSYYNVPIVLSLQGSLVLSALEHSLNHIIERHEILRTRFVMLDGQVRQMVDPEFCLHIDSLDLLPVEDSHRQAEADRLMVELGRKPFNLSSGPLIRVTLLSTGPETHFLLIVVHHILIDEWSLDILLKELQVLYNAALEGETPVLPELPIQFSDYAVWQRARLQAGEYESQLAYWKDQLNGAAQVIELPTDYPRPAALSYPGNIAARCFDQSILIGLQRLSKQDHVTLFMILLAAFQVLLYRYTHQTDFLVGSPISNRRHSQLENLIGFFLNTLVFRARFDSPLTFRQYLSQVRAAVLGGFDHQDLPFDQLVEALNPSRDSAHNPLFQVSLVWHPWSETTIRLRGLETSLHPLNYGWSKFDLSLFLAEKNDRLEAKIIYRTDLFLPATIQRLLAHFENLLRAIALEPDRMIDQLPLLEASEKSQILVEWNKTQQPFPAGQLIQHAFEAQVRLTPAAPAVLVDQPEQFRDSGLPGNASLTYSELNAHANQLAHLLQRQGVGPDDIVGICMERSLELVVAILGVLKAGGAYVPLEPSYPADRLSFMLKDSAAKVILTQPALAERFSDAEGSIVCLEPGWKNLSGEDGQDFPCLAAPDNLAYVIYTSGSTGLPKGAMIPHRALVNQMTWMQRAYPLNPADRVLQKTPISFDASVWEFYAPLRIGAQLVMAQPGGHRDAAYLLEAVQRNAITILQVVPTILRMMAGEPGLSGCSSLRRLFCGGEALPPDLPERIYRAVNVDLINLYGPAETCINTITGIVPSKEFRSSVPIGRPVANTQIYILDEAFEPVPVGVIGEIFIGGACLGRGYLGDPVKTAERFVPDPFSPLPGARLYRTGDLGRYLPDGNIDYLGRADFQIKLGGVRVETAEIEHAINAHPAVRQAVVLAREDQLLGKRLVAYISTHGSSSLTIPELRDFLRTRLSESLVPSAYVFLQEFPHLPNGKLDRSALPDPQTETVENSIRYVAPGDDVERLLCQVWETVLDVKPVGIQDNFFDLGGHSLLAIRLVVSIEQQFGQRLPIPAVFQYPTVSGLAQLLRQGRKNPSRRSIIRREEQGPAPLSFGQERMWFLDRLGVGEGTYNVPMVYRIQGPIQIEALEDSLNQIIQRHEILRTRFAEIDGEARQLTAPGGTIRVNQVDLRLQPEKEREQQARDLLDLLGRKDYDLENGPLVRVDLVRLSGADYFLMVCFHHIIIDEWSVEIFYQELAHFYNSAIKGDSSQLPGLSIQYADYAAWQAEWLHSEIADAQLRYWKEKLSGAPHELDLPYDHARPVLPSYRGGVIYRTISLATLAALRQISRSDRVTLFITLLTAFQLLLYRYTGQEDLLVGSPIANRRQIELEDLIGFFLNTLVFRGDLKGNPTFRELLRRTGKTAIDAFDHQDLPFERLVEELRPQRDLSRHPIFQAAFVLHPRSLRRLQLDGLLIIPTRINLGRSKFDLTLFLSERLEGLEAHLEYSADVFEPQTVARMLEHFDILLQSIVQNPDLPVNYLALLTQGEQRQILQQYNQTHTAYPDSATVHGLFEQQARQTSEALAVLASAGKQSPQSSRFPAQLTYTELNQRANQLASYLRRRGVHRNSLVAIRMERSPEMVVALLAVLKAGGAYVPLDPSYPVERLAFMIADAGASVLLCLGDLSIGLPSGTIEQIRLDAVWPRIAEEPSIDPLDTNQSMDRAYVMYTSGSTGRPKGIEIPHRAIVRLVKETDYVHITEGDRIAQASNMSFDAATFEIWGALLNGGSLVMIPQDVVLSPAEYAQAIHRLEIQSLFVTTALFNQVANLEPDAFRSVREVMFGGEAVTPAWVRKVLESGKPARLLHVYGPTESTTFATWYQVQDVEPEARNVPIGKPIANTRVYILDRWQNPVPLGVPGELYLAGDGLALGYLNRPELTAERFLPDPFSQPGQRMYRTGDLVRMLPSGDIEFLGRIDNQVKLRGFRIELGEIESALSAHPELSQAVVLLRSSGEGLDQDKRLVAYLVSKTGSEPTLQELRAYLKSSLPEYMIPSVFIFLKELPLNPNGKVDRKALPAPATVRTVTAEGYLAPRDELESRLCQVWEQVLGLQPVGVNDNFFELGGHSLLAVRLFGKIEQELAQRLPLATLFQFPTVAELAALLRQEQPAADWSALVAIQPQGDRPPFFCVHNFGGEALDLAPLAQALGPDQPFFGLQALGLDGVHEPHTSIPEMAAYYLGAVRQQQPHGPYYLGGYCFGGVVAYEMACQLNKSGEHVALVVVFDASPPGYSRSVAGWSLRQLFDYVINLPFWLRDFFQMNRAERGVVVRRRLKRISKAAARLVGSQAEMTPLEIIGEHVHVMEAPLHRRNLMELHMQAIRAYRAPTYPGRVTAFRVRRMPLFSRQSFDMGWGKVAQGGVDLRLVPGAHHNLMSPPFVQELAQQMRACIDQAHKIP